MVQTEATTLTDQRKLEKMDSHVDHTGVRGGPRVSRRNPTWASQAQSLRRGPGSIWGGWYDFYITQMRQWCGALCALFTCAFGTRQPSACRSFYGAQVPHHGRSTWRRAS